MNEWIKLQWGETPWDKLSQEELLREVQRIFSALQSTESVLRILRAQDVESSFWSDQGTGGQALDRAAQVINPIYERYDGETMYKSFFRYAPSLLFNVPVEEKWIICPVCGGMWGWRKDIAQYVGTLCSEHPMTQQSECKGVLRWLEWSDLAK